MSASHSEKSVLVTGGSGYLASWIVRQLLEQGYRVHTTVRNLSDEVKTGHLITLSEEFPGMVTIFEADLLQKDSFDEAAMNCSVVIHTASPFKLGRIRNPEKELIIPAVNGVGHVFSAALKSGTVSRIVMTSSVAAVYGDAIEVKKAPGGIFTGENWNTTSSKNHQPYSWSKTLAEMEAWKLAAATPGIGLNVINPGFILGPSLSARNDSISISVMKKLISGSFRMGVPKGNHAVVDVRDAAAAHILAALLPDAGFRFITAPHPASFTEFASIIRKKYPGLPVPARSIPTLLFIFAGPLMGYPARFILRNVGYNIRFDNSLAEQKLGIRFRPLEETLLDQVAQILCDSPELNVPEENKLRANV
jgi:nucleoside-diphosphate-sugar epimerase